MYNGKEITLIQILLQVQPTLCVCMVPLIFVDFIYFVFFFTGGELLNNQRDIAYSTRSPHRLTNGNASTTAAALMSSLGGAAASMMSSTTGEIFLTDSVTSHCLVWFFGNCSNADSISEAAFVFLTS